MALLAQQHLVLVLMLIPTRRCIPMGFALHRMAHRLIASLLARLTVYTACEILFGKWIDRSLIYSSGELEVQRLDSLVDDCGPAGGSNRCI